MHNCVNKLMSLEIEEENQTLLGLKSHVCEACEKSFSFKRSLWRHIRIKHNHDFEKLYPIKRQLSNLKYKCELCNRSYKTNKILRFHKKKYHELPSVMIKMHMCALCKDTFELKDIIQHFETVHDIEIKYENHEFQSFEEFLAWKSNIEINSKSKFTKYTEDTVSYGKSYSFRCHRSGDYRSQSKGLRHPKMQGSNKINAYCPAIIKVKENDRGQCSVLFQTSHVGHHNDVTHLPLTKEEKKYIASKIAAKIPFDEILDEIRDSIFNSGSERLHLLTKGDLRNMVREFNLTSINTKHKKRCIASIKGNREIILSKLRDLRNRHKASLKLALQILKDDEGWLVSSKIDKKIYQIKRGEENCQCQLICNHCGACAHMYLCTCIDSSINLNMCKHIHFLCKENEEMRSTRSVETESNESLSEIGFKEGNEIVTEELSHEDASNSLSIQERIEKIQKDYFNVINSASNSEQLDILENNVKLLQTKMEVIE